MRRYYLAFIAIILLVALTTPDAQSVTKEEVEAARTVAEKTGQALKIAQKRRKQAEQISAKKYEAYMKAGYDYRETINALEKAKTKGDEAARLAAEKAEREARIRRDNASEEYERADKMLNEAEFEVIERENAAGNAESHLRVISMKRQREEEAAQRKAVKAEYAKAKAAWKKADADVKERRKKEMQACNAKAQKEIFPPGLIEEEKVLRQLTGHGSIEFARLQNAFSQAVAKCHQKIEKSFPLPQPPSYTEIEKRYQSGLRPGHNVEE